MSALVKCAHQASGPGDAQTSRGPTQEADAPMSDQRISAAREALAAHDELKASFASEPASDHDGIPLNPFAWLKWRDEISTPAYERWGAAMDALALALDEPNLSRHPYNFRPICEAILRGE